MQFAPAVWGIPVVQSATERAVLFPTPLVNQRVQNLETHAFERWDGTQWLADSGSGDVVLVGDGTTESSATLQAAIDTMAPYTTLRLFGTFLLGTGLTVTTDHIRILGPAVLKAATTADFLVVLTGAGRTGVTVEGITFDVNATARALDHTQTVAYCGAGFTASTDCAFINCAVRDTLGLLTGSATGITISGACTRCRIHGCTATVLGTLARESDAFFIKGTQCVVSNCIANSATDTGYVVEDSDYTVVSGCTAVDCLSPFAVTCSDSTSHYGNAVVGFTSRASYSSIQVMIGTVANATGNLYDTVIDGFNLKYTAIGTVLTGPAIKVVNGGGGGRAIRVTIANGRIDGATTQGVLVTGGDEVEISNVSIKNATDALVDFRTASTKGVVANCRLDGGAFGITASDTSDVIAQGNIIRNCSDHCIYAGGTSTLTAIMNVLVPVANRIGKDGGATLNVLGIEGTSLVINSQTGAAPSGAQNNKFPVYDKAGTLLGYVPIYNS